MDHLLSKKHDIFYKGLNMLYLYDLLQQQLSLDVLSPSFVHILQQMGIALGKSMARK